MQFLFVLRLFVTVNICHPQSLSHLIKETLTNLLCSTETGFSITSNPYPWLSPKQITYRSGTLFAEVNVSQVIVSFPLYIYESIFVHACDTTISNGMNI